MLANPKVRALAALGLALFSACQANTPYHDATSNCDPTPNAPWLQAGFTVQHVEPRVCPVPTSDIAVSGIPKAKAYYLHIYDAQNRATPGQYMTTQWLDGRGVLTMSASTSFSSFNIGQPVGQLAAEVNNAYSPGMAGFGTAVPRVNGFPQDMAVHSTALGSNTAQVTIALPYRLEGAAAMSGPAVATYHDNVTFTATNDELRKPTTFQWRWDGVPQSNGVASNYTTSTFQPTYTVGTHTATVVVTSDLGTVSTRNTSITISAPPECGGGGGAQFNSCPP